jgi:hypothetical protein
MPIDTRAIEASGRPLTAAATLTRLAVIGAVMLGVAGAFGMAHWDEQHPGLSCELGPGIL